MLTTLVMNHGILERVVASVVNTAQGDLPPTQFTFSQKMNLASINKPIHFTSIRLFYRYHICRSLCADGNRRYSGALLKYSEQLNAQFDEIAAPRQRSKKHSLTQSVLLDTPAVSLPIAVQTDRAMYQFVNPQLEALSQYRSSYCAWDQEYAFGDA